MLRVVVMVSGGGTNLQAILDAVDNGKITNAEVAAVISNNEGVYAIERAKKHGVPAFVVTPKAYETRDAFDEALLETVKACKPDLIVHFSLYFRPCIQFHWLLKDEFYFRSCLIPPVFLKRAKEKEYPHLNGYSHFYHYAVFTISYALSIIAFPSTVRANRFSR